MRNKPTTQFSVAVLLINALLWSAAAVAHDRFSRMVVFGDSLSDSGNAFVLLREVAVPPYELIPDAPYARGGLRFSNGRTWVEQLARRLDARHGARPALLARGVFTNYAVGGARARPSAPFDLSSQVGLFLEDFRGAAPRDALYVVHVGGNDVFDALTALATDPSGAASAAILDDALSAIANNLTTLAASGARQFLAPNSPDLALTPVARLQGPQAQAAAHALSVGFNQALAAILAHAEASSAVTIHRLDLFALLNETVAAPAAAGLTDVAMPCITPGVFINAECDRPDNYLFWDGLHPTRAGHALIAQRALRSVKTPSSATSR